jgi:hypothetical protein
MEGWWTIGWFTVEINVNSKASHESKHSLVKETKEDAGSNISDKANNHEWSDWGADLFYVISIFHNHVATKQVQNHDGQLSESNECCGKEFGPCKLQGVLYVQQETIPGRAAEAIS